MTTGSPFAASAATAGAVPQPQGGTIPQPTAEQTAVAQPQPTAEPAPPVQQPAPQPAVDQTQVAQQPAAQPQPQTQAAPFAAQPTAPMPSPFAPGAAQGAAPAQPTQTGFAPQPAQPQQPPMQNFGAAGFNMPQPPAAVPAQYAPMGGVPGQYAPQQGFGLPQQAEDEEVVTFDSDIQMSALEKYPKMALNQVTRNAFILFDERNSPRFVKTDTFSTTIGQQNVYFRAPKNPELLKACIQRFGEPKLRLGTILMRYDTDNYGNLLPNAGYKLFAYVIGKDMFPTLKQQHNEWGLQNHDVLFTCTEPHFQKTTTSLARECLWRANPALVAEVTQKAQALFDAHLGRYMGMRREDQHILMILNGQLPPLPGQRQMPGQGGMPMQGGMPGMQPVNPFAAGGAQQPQVQYQPAAPTVNAPGAGVGTTEFGHLLAHGTQQA